MSSYNYGFNNPVIYNDPSGMAGENAGVWYWDKKHTEPQFAKGYTYSNLPSSMGTPQDSDFIIPWDNLRVSRH